MEEVDKLVEAYADSGSRTVGAVQKLREHRVELVKMMEQELRDALSADGATGMAELIEQAEVYGMALNAPRKVIILGHYPVLF